MWVGLLGPCAEFAVVLFVGVIGPDLLPQAFAGAREGQDVLAGTCQGRTHWGGEPVVGVDESVQLGRH